MKRLIIVLLLAALFITGCQLDLGAGASYRFLQEHEGHKSRDPWFSYGRAN